MIDAVTELLLVIMGGMIIGGTAGTALIAWVSCRANGVRVPVRLKVYTAVVAVVAVGWAVHPFLRD